MRTDHRPERGLVTGVFDLFHPGHVFFLEEASKRAQEIWVVVAHDQTVERTKGRPPVWNQEQRIRAIEKAFPMAHVLAGGPIVEDLVQKILLEVKPQIHLLGHDQCPHPQLQEAAIPSLQLKAKEPTQYSSSILRPQEEARRKGLTEVVQTRV